MRIISYEQIARFAGQFIEFQFVGSPARRGRMDPSPTQAPDGNAYNIRVATWNGGSGTHLLDFGAIQQGLEIRQLTGLEARDLEFKGQVLK